MSNLQNLEKVKSAIDLKPKCYFYSIENPSIDFITLSTLRLAIKSNMDKLG